MKLELITPLVLTYNEEPNIRRCLERLQWASRVVVIDSGSTDRTLALCAEFPNVEVVHRDFDSFAGQCNAGLLLITSAWVLSLDADYLVPEDFAIILETLSNSDDVQGYRLPFRYCVFGRALRCCLYPPRTVLYRRETALYQDDGHGHRVAIMGVVHHLPFLIDHDDHKPLSRWFQSQLKYAILEAEKLSATSSSEGLPDRVRRLIWPAVPAVFLYTLLVKRLILDGWPGLFYVLQRTFAEMALSLVLLEKKFTFPKSPPKFS
jgi:glycosyltransferase involved in cell wall biosynthesis